MPGYRSRWNFRLARVALVGAAYCGLATICQAVEPYADFLHALQRNGLGEMAISYLESIQNRPDLPADLKDEFDLEMHNSLEVAAQETTQTELRQQRLEAAKARMEAFMKAHPNHPGVASALMSGANEPFDRGQKLLSRAEATFDQVTKDALLTDARAALAEARPHIEKAVETFRQQLAAIGKLPTPVGNIAIKARAAERAATVRAVVEGLYRLAGLDYALGQTYGPKDPARRKNLEAASKNFYEVYTGVPGGFESKMGLMWHAKCQADLGDLDTALDMFDEAKTGEPTDGTINADVADFYGQLEGFNIQAILAKKGAKGALEEAAEWQKSHASWKKFNAWHAVQMEVAKVHLAQVAKNPAAQQEALAILDEVIKSSSEFKGAAMVMRRKALGQGAPAESLFDEKLEQARSAHAAGKLTEAIELYGKILADWPKDKSDKIKAETVRELNQARYRQANKLYADKHYDEATAAAKAIADEFPDDPQAVSASVLTVFCRLSQFEGAKKEARAAALKDLQEAAENVMKRFPDKPEAEDARLAVAQAYFKELDFDHALPLFEQTKKESKRYGAALDAAAQIYLQRYIAERKKPEQDRNQDAIKGMREKALEQLLKSLKWQKDKLDPRDPLPPAIHETQLRVAQLYLEGKQSAEASALLDPMLADLAKQKQDVVDPTTVGIYLLTVRALVESNNVMRAGQVAGKLIEAGPDTEAVNNALVEFVKLLSKDVKEADTARLDAESKTDPVATVNAKNRYAAARKLWDEVVGKVAARKQHTMAGALYMADACATAGFRKAARDLLLGFVEKTKSDAEFAKKAAPFMTAVNTQLFRLLRDEGDYEKALEGVDSLIKEHPTVLEPIIEKAKILQEWADKKEPKKYALAAAQWTQVRVAIGAVKPKSDEYYEAIYHVAECLLADGKSTNDKKKLLQAEQVLRATLISTPDLSGPDMITRYNALLKQIYAVAGKEPPKEAPKEPPK